MKQTKQYDKRKKKKDTSLFFDSFKHFKHNISNLISIELPTLYSLGAESYLNLIPTNYKSKYPDMRKIGLIEYKKPSDNQFVLTQEGEKLLKLLKNTNIYNEYSIRTSRKNIDSVSASKLISMLNNKVEYQEVILTIILSYYDTADFIRPYLALLHFIQHHKIQKLSNTILRNILAHNKQDILLMQYKENAFNNLDEQIKVEVSRPISYIYNFLQSALILDDQFNVVIDFGLINAIQNTMNAVVINRLDKNNNLRPAKEQRLFRENVLMAYNYKCAITNKAIWIDNRCLLEAAHIIPYRNGGSFSVNNGIALSYEMHKMFDSGLFGFEVKQDSIYVKIAKSKRIKDDDILQKLDNKPIYLPKEKALYPNADALRYNLDTFLLKD